MRFKPQFRAKPGRVVLHVPPAPWLKRVLINDRKEVSAKAETVEL